VAGLIGCGMIVGFDHDSPSLFRILPKFLADARIAHALIGLLHAIPTTPLYDRLKKEGRLNDNNDSAAFGTNVAPLGMSREELRKGFIEVTQEVYAADAYFQRMDALFVEGGFKFAVHELSYWQQHRWAQVKIYAGNYLKFLVLAGRTRRGAASGHDHGSTKLASRNGTLESPLLPAVDFLKFGVANQPWKLFCIARCVTHL
jgi:hypothetical protein